MTYLSAKVTVIWPFDTSFEVESSLVDATASFIWNNNRKSEIRDSLFIPDRINLEISNLLISQ